MCIIVKVFRVHLPSPAFQHFCIFSGLLSSYSFCLVQPLESMTPLILNPHLNYKKPLYIELLNKVYPFGSNDQLDEDDVLMMTCF